MELSEGEGVVTVGQSCILFKVIIVFFRMKYLQYSVKFSRILGSLTTIIEEVREHSSLIYQILRQLPSTHQNPTEMAYPIRANQLVFLTSPFHCPWCQASDLP